MKRIKKWLIGYRYLIGLLLLLFVLVIPLALKTLNPNYEPYPAIILPSGEWLAEKENTHYTFVTYALYGFDEQDGALKKLNTRMFLKPIPATYIYSLSSIEFGTKKSAPPFLRSKFFDYETIENQKRKETSYEWIRKKLKAQNCKTSTLTIRVFNCQISNRKREIIKKELIDEKIIELPQ